MMDTTMDTIIVETSHDEFKFENVSEFQVEGELLHIFKDDETVATFKYWNVCYKKKNNLEIKEHYDGL